MDAIQVGGGHDGLSMLGFRVIVLADACASQAIDPLSPQQAHAAAIGRMGYLFAAIEDTSAFIGRLAAPTTPGAAAR